MKRNSTTGGEASSTQQTAELWSKNSKSRKNSRKFNNVNEVMEEEDEEEAVLGLKKLDHNAKERIRRMKLNASYLALRALLPDSRRSKKKWCAPAIVDRVLKYIPELENEVEALRCNKENHMQSQKQAKDEEINSSSSSTAKHEITTPTISLNRVNREEAVVQVCMARDQDESSRFMNLLQSVEDEGFCIKSASALDISETTICHNLHIQADNITGEADHQFEELRNKVISWSR